MLIIFLIFLLYFNSDIYAKDLKKTTKSFSNSNFAIFWTPLNSNSIVLEPDSPYFIYQEPIIFTNFNNYLSNIFYNQNNGAIIFADSGLYKISFFVNYTISYNTTQCSSAPLVSVGLFLSGSNMPILGAQPVISGSLSFGSSIIQIQAGQFINLDFFVSPSTSCSQVTLTPIQGNYPSSTNSSFLLVEQIG